MSGASCALRGCGGAGAAAGAEALGCACCNSPALIIPGHAGRPALPPAPVLSRRHPPPRRPGGPRPKNSRGMRRGALIGAAVRSDSPPAAGAGAGRAAAARSEQPVARLGGGRGGGGGQGRAPRAATGEGPAGELREAPGIWLPAARGQQPRAGPTPRAVPVPPPSLTRGSLPVVPAALPPPRSCPGHAIPLSPIPSAPMLRSERDEHRCGSPDGNDTGGIRLNSALEA